MSKIKTYTIEELTWYSQDLGRIERLLKERDLLRARLDKIEQLVT